MHTVSELEILEGLGRLASYLQRAIISVISIFNPWHFMDLNVIKPNRIPNSFESIEWVSLAETKVEFSPSMQEALKKGIHTNSQTNSQKTKKS